jgi:hypothetical protein
MMSESDSTSGRRPPTIELKATEVEQPKAPPDTAAAAAEPARKADAPAEPVAAPETSGPNPSSKSEVRLFAHAVSAAIGAIAAAAVLVGLWLAGFTLARDVVTESTVPIPGAATPGAATNGLNATVSARLDKIERAIQAPKPEAAIPPELGNRLTALEMQAKMLGDSVAALHRRTDDIAATAQAAQNQAVSAASVADATKNAEQPGVQSSDLEALANRIAALESAVKAVSEQVAHPPAGADQVARLTVAAEALRAAVERSAPYQAELKAVQSLGADQSATAPLEAFAAIGMPHADALAHELATLVPALRQAAVTSSGDASFLSKLEANAQNLVRITPVDAPIGNDPASVIARIDIDASHADIAAALNEIAALPDSAKPPVADWVKRAQAREAAIAASRNITADALAALSRPAAQ